MRYSPKNYAVALSKSLQESKEERNLFANFLKLIKKNGDQKILPRILEEFKKIEIKRGGGSRVKIEFAREPLEAQVKSITRKFGNRDWVETSLNPSLVAGVRITIDGESEIDNSLARKLHKLFR